ncbi:MAG TPA: LCP family protein [Patescibacteria group bacterium]|nr:LCP family protein [Patescibacteria group bacterium]
MQENPVKKTQKPFVIRVLICFVFAVVFFCIGFTVYFLGALEQFITSAMNQHITLKTLVSTSQLPNQTNVLLLGSDNDQKFTGNPLTQTMMVVHIDYAKKEVDMFSIPRDLWVKMPDQQIYGKIDQAAEYEGIPSAIKVVEQTFGIPIDHYAWVGLYGFIKSIDTIGGINLQVVHPVLDNAYPTDINSSNPYGYQRLDIQPGMQHMTGEEALQYVRSRHEDLIGDFGRTERQRQLLLALKQTLLSSPNLLTDAPRLFDNLKGQIKTDVTLTDSAQLGFFFLTNKNSLIEKQFTLSPPTYSQVGTSSDGQSIVIANATESAKLVETLFGTKAAQTTLTNLSNEQDIQQ